MSYTRQYTDSDAQEPCELHAGQLWATHRWRRSLQYGINEYAHPWCATMYGVFSALGKDTDTEGIRVNIVYAKPADSSH